MYALAARKLINIISLKERFYYLVINSHKALETILKIYEQSDQEKIPTVYN
jgi:hypothetical protein